MSYTELAVTTNFSFLRGASHPEEMVTAAAALGLSGIGVADRNSLAGVVRAHEAAKEQGLRLCVGARVVPRDGPEVIVYPRDRAAYGRLCRLLTLGKRRAGKGECQLDLADLPAFAEGQIAIVLPPEAVPLPERFARDLATLAETFAGACYLGVSARFDGEDSRRFAALKVLSEQNGIKRVALGDVQMHHAGRKPLSDVLTCIRHGCTIDEAGFRLERNAERRLKGPEAMAKLFADDPEALAATEDIAAACTFSLDELRYEYPEECQGRSRSPQEELEFLTWEGVKERYPGGLPHKVRATLERELALIRQLDYAPYFLTVFDIVRFARSRGILCQGRGSAANSAVCYCLGITAVDPARLDLLFERFISAARDEPPDIDVDFEHERREEVIQYIYAKYGRERAGLAATVICYRRRGAIRDVGKAMGLSADTLTALSSGVWGQRGEGGDAETLRSLGLDPEEPRLKQTLALIDEIRGFPRHLSQHVGGFVMTRGRLDEVVPIENAAMENRTVIEWDKDDLDALGMLKVDVLGLGMLTCIRKGFDLIARHCGQRYTLASVPPGDSGTYEMLCRADSIGVFQVESRAQMTMLPRLKPRRFYDLVIEVAIVRPGPIQGDMVHPYLRRRNGEEEVRYPSAELERVLGKTLGVPLFQEQAMQIAIVAAGFTPDEADRLRRAMATFKRHGDVHRFQERLIEGMVERGYERDFAERCYKQIEGFGTYGFPESHAASFALLVYVSAWMKHRYPAAFACALLNSQPMGFYAPAQIVRDAREHGVEVRPVDVNRSDWDCTLEPGVRGLALRLGLRQVKGLGERAGRTLAAARGNGYADPLAIWRRCHGAEGTGVARAALEALARADAFGSMGLDRRNALWAVKALPDDAPLPLFAAAGEEERGEDPPVSLPEIAAGEQVVDDYASLRLTLRAHPLSFLRESLAAEGHVKAEDLWRIPNGQRVRTAGLVLLRQRPGSAKGVIFATIEDETGVANVVLWPNVFDRFRRPFLQASLLSVRGRIQREGLVLHLVAETLSNESPRLAALQAPGFQNAMARADEVKKPGREVVYPSRDFR